MANHSDLQWALPLHEFPRPLRQGDFQDQLRCLQGNILKGHGRNRAIYVFLRFDRSKAKQIKVWIQEIAPRVTSAYQQLEEAENYQRYHLPGKLFVSFLLSAQGYRALGIDPAQHNRAFQAGMRARAERLNDSQEPWEEGYRNVHAMMILADDKEEVLEQAAIDLIDKVNTKEIASVCHVEHGKVLRNRSGDAIEHFGYVDGRSQPLFFCKDIKREKYLKDGVDVWDPSAGPDLVLARDPCSAAWTSGSYVVFRKLEQNVRGFWEKVYDLATELGLAEQDATRVGALAIGRFEDGTPIALQSKAGMSHPVPNNFTYANDPKGNKCPFHAHIRKMNSRGTLRQQRERDLARLLRADFEPKHRIVRRGIPYGNRDNEPKNNPRLEALPTEGVGLLFMCYQRDIEQQFEFLQAQWANNPRHFTTDEHRDAPGIDPIIGSARNTTVDAQRWPAQWGTMQTEHKQVHFGRFVTLRGGEYFFAPSIKFLQTIR